MGWHNKSRNNNNRCNSVSPAEDKVIVHPTKHVVKNTTNHRTVKNIHPTEVENVNRTIIRNEHFYPVSNSNVNETVVEDYNCGSDVNSPNCRRVSPEQNGNCRGTSPERNHKRCKCGCKGWSWI